MYGGYQTDLSCTDLSIEGDIPADKIIGGFGVTTGLADDYNLVLETPIQNYRKGLKINVQFHVGNTGSANLKIGDLTRVVLKKLLFDELVDLEPNDLKPEVIYELIYDGEFFQISNGVKPLVTNSELRIKGLFDASGAPRFPAGKKGDAYTISGKGMIGGDDTELGLDANVRDLLYCLEDNEGGDFINPNVQAGWNLIRARSIEATEDVAGVARFAKSTELNASSPQANLMVSAKGLKEQFNELPRVLFTDIQTLAAETIGTDTEVEIPPAYSIPMNTLKRDQGVRIHVTGHFSNVTQNGSPSLLDRSFSLYINDQLVSTNFIKNLIGDFKVEVVLYFLLPNVVKGWSRFNLDQFPEQFDYVQISDLDFSTENAEIRMTAQAGEAVNETVVTRYLWRIERII